ncbi:LacI family transcriptional regulator [Nakamurella antarctica]|uniref:LacI family transcriptional regulator n=1 Tax=Nakamurella antarctica TaxID=1902245 RepID=A0A3G8ZXM8_9ACTN|nr:LacI family DNA-binding transcriptional regulator [Nakamurella antarctica]AZI59174.1 LacI family transcriptional regulator [Nakamurella antarctica]
MSGIVDLAAHVGVSPATVSRALRGLPGVSDNTRERIRLAADQLGYVASPSASSLPTGKTKAIGVLVPWISRWFFNAVVEGAQEVVAHHGYDLVLYAAGTSTSRPRTIDARVLSKRVDGVLALSVNLSHSEAEALQASRSALVTVGPAAPGFSSVSVDDVRVGIMATQHLLTLGHRRIAFFGGDPYDMFGFPVAPDRQAGYEKALRAAGIEPRANWILPAEFSVFGGESAFVQLWQEAEHPTAIVAASDEIAMGILHMARAMGVSVPGELSVVGVDDHDLSYLFGLTTVAQPVRHQGELAAELLLKLMKCGPSREPETIQVATVLIDRATTAPPS